MNELSLIITEDGGVRVSVNGIVIGLIEEITVHHREGLVPKVKVKMKDVNTCTAAKLKEQLLVHLHRYRETLLGFKCVELFDAADTLPSGMAAVRPEKESED